MLPLTVTAHLSTPPILDRPVLFDGLLLFGIGKQLGVEHPSGVTADEDAYEIPLPLARVETAHGWWYAASHVLPSGPESQGHLNRVPLVEEQARWTSSRSLTQGSGPDKRLRIPYYYRASMLDLTWTCVGDGPEIARLLSRVYGVGRLTGHGHGWVRRWSVEEGGPDLAEYGRDLTLRHLPAELRVSAARMVRRHMPLRPPYHRRRDAVPCWQVAA